MRTTLARRYAAVIACVGLGLATSAFAQDKTVKIGVLNDMSSLYADIGGPNSVAAIKMAVEDSGLLAKGWKIDVLSGDHQNKPDVGVNIARQWIDSDKVDAIADTPNSGVALAVSNLIREKNAVLLNSGAATADLTGKACTPNTVSFTYDTYMLAHGTGAALTKAGGNTWFFLTSDYAFGHALERDTSAVVTASGGKVLGGVRHPINTADFSSFLLQAQAPKAKVIGLANVVAKMKELPTDDPLFGNGPLRADGRRMIPAYLFEVKKPEESKYPWDYYKMIATIPAEEAARPLSESECPLVKK